ncbi:hypothetical protein Tco_1534064, partial [Tanacetum coccineum]
MVKMVLVEAIDSLVPLDEHLTTFRGIGYRQKDEKTEAPNWDKNRATEFGNILKSQKSKPNSTLTRTTDLFKSERPRISKPRFASQVDVNNNLLKPVTTHYLPKRRESAPAKPHHMIAPSSSRYSSNDIVHNHYLEEAKKKTHEHSRIPRNFSDSKHFVCLTTSENVVFNANHDACVIKFLKEVNSRAKVPSNKTTNRNKPIEQIRVATKPKRQIPKGHKFSINKTITVHEKTTSPRSCLRWQPTGRILKIVCLRWVPTGKTFASSTTKVHRSILRGRTQSLVAEIERYRQKTGLQGILILMIMKNDCLNTFCSGLILYQMMRGRTQSLVAKKKDIAENRASRNFDLMITSGLVLHQMTSDHNRSELGIQDHSNEPSSSKLVPKVVPLAVKTATSRQELELLFHHHIAMPRTT